MIRDRIHGIPSQPDDDVAPWRLQILAGAPDSPAVPAAAPPEQLAIAQRTEITFIESNVADLPTLLKGLAGNEVHVLDAGRDGLQQIAAILDGRAGVDALHIISHGATAAVNFGALKLDGGNLDAHRADLDAIGRAMADGGDILLYGCDVAAGGAGAAFIDRLAGATGADVAASTNPTGAAALGGDWRLEVHSGAIETAAVVDPALAALYQQTLAIPSASVNFNTGANFANGGGYLGNQDVIYNVAANSSYQLKINGQNEGVVNFGGYVASDAGYARGETLLTLSFVGGQVFTPTSLKVGTQISGAQNLIFKGYDTAGNQVGGNQTFLTSASTGTYLTATLSGLTNIATLKVTADPASNGGKMVYLIFDDLALSNIQPPAPSVTMITSSTANGSYKVGDTIAVNVTFDSAVTVAGTPQLTLATGGGGRAVNYASGSGSTTLTFNYTVQAGDSSGDLDIFSTGALSLNGGSITQTVGAAAATLTLPTPGAAGSLAANKALVIDGIAPTLAISSDVASLKAGQTATITFTFSENPGATFTWDGSSGDVVVTGGTLGAISGSGLTRTATFTPTASTNAGTASITVAAGSYADTAGNVGGAGTTPSLSFDTLAPSAPSTPALASASDTGTSPTDRVTNDTTPTFSGTADAGATVKLYDTDGTTLLGTTTADGGGAWTITSAALAAGAHSVSVKATDAAGNTGTASATQTVTIMTAAPTVSISSDVASIKAGETATITFTFSSDPGATFTWNGSSGDVVVTGGTLGAISGSGLTRTATFTPTAATDSTTASITVTGASYADVAGNGGAAGLTPILQVDTIALTPSAPTITAGSDTGLSSSDAITSDSTPTVTGTAEANATVRLYDTDGTTVLGTATANGSGAWSITSSTLAEGSHTLTARVTDVAGNVSAAGAALTAVIDTSVAAPATPTLASASDSGTPGDGVTSSATPTISGTAEANAAVTLYDTDGVTVVGTATANGSGAWSIATSTLGDGAHTLTAVQTDRAGNVSAASAGLALTIDTLAPAAPGAPVLAVASDSGAAGDGITNVANPVLTGTALANAVVRLYDSDGTTVLGTATADGAGNWSITSGALTVGAHTLTARQFDLAGNASVAGASLALTIEAAPVPTTPPATTIDGVAVVQTPVVLPGGGIGTQTVIGIVSDSRSESSGNAGVADIPLVTGGGANLLLAQIAPGYGLTASSGASQPAGSSTDQLIQAILGVTPDHPAADQGHLTGNGVAFLNQLAASTPLLVSTIVPISSATAPAGALTLTGTSSAAQHTALVIDASELAAGSKLVLNAVDFAAVIGAVDVTGNTAGQVLTGDAASQRFTVPSASGGAVFAGGGADTLVFNSPSAVAGAAAAVNAARAMAAAPADTTTILHGGLGSDSVAFSGASADYTIDLHQGYAIVTAKAQPQQHALVINAESLKFADTTLSVENPASLGTITGLYQSVLGRQGDHLGVEFWAKTYVSGLSMGEIAINLIQSSESQQRHPMVFNGDGAHDVELLYQGIFGRHSDAGGLTYWTEKVAAGMSLARVADFFVAAPEMDIHKIGAQNWDFLVSS